MEKIMKNHTIIQHIYISAILSYPNSNKELKKKKAFSFFKKKKKKRKRLVGVGLIQGSKRGSCLP